MDNFAIYAPLFGLPDADTLEMFAPGSSITEKPNGVVVIAWPDVKVTISTMPREQLMQHLQGLIGWVKKNGGSTALATRVQHTLGVFGCQIEPGFDDKSFALCSGLMQGAMGFAFFRDTLIDGERDLMRDGLEVPSAERVARRAEILLALASRALLEDDAGKPEEADAQKLCDEIGEWIGNDAERLDEIEEEEMDFLDTQMGELDPQDRVNRVWGAEAACAMLWALGVYELPPISVSQHPYELARLIGIRGEAKLTAPQLRPLDELEALRNRYTAMHWRLVEKRLHPDKALDFVAFAKKGGWLAPFDPIAFADIPLDGNDLRIDNVPMTTSIVRERHRGLNWLVGVHPLFSSIETPT